MDALNLVAGTILRAKMIGLDEELQSALEESDCFAAIEDLSCAENLPNEEVKNYAQQILTNYQ